MLSNASAPATLRGHCLPSAIAPRLNTYRRHSIMSALVRCFRAKKIGVAVRRGSPQPPDKSHLRTASTRSTNSTAG
eukprot:747493-Pyramimonas_sp.AAC.1